MAISVNALVTLLEVTAYITNSVEPSKEDNNLRNTINGVTSKFETYVGYNLKARTYMPSGADESVGEENLKLNGNDRLTGTKFLLPHFPVSAITAGVIKDANLLTLKTLDVSTDLVFDPKTGIVQLIDGDVWAGGIQNIELTWTAGFSPVPDDLKLACIMQTLNDFYGINRNRLGMKSVSVQGENISFEFKEFLDKVKGTLDRYRALKVK